VVVFHRSMLSFVFEQHAQGVADGTTGYAEKFHHVLAVEIGPFGLALLFDRQ
jgi:hypothetical protein